MPQVTFTQPTPKDVDELVANMRRQDVDECYAAGHTDLHAVVRDGIRRSVRCWTCRTDGHVAAIFGVAPFGGLIGATGVPWLLGTPEVPRHRRTLARVAKPYIAQMLELYPRLLNAVHAKNTVAVHWLRRTGFKLQPAAPCPPHGELFHVFELKR
jgi:hypothetical protein